MRGDSWVCVLIFWSTLRLYCQYVVFDFEFFVCLYCVYVAFDFEFSVFVFDFEFFGFVFNF